MKCHSISPLSSKLVACCRTPQYPQQQRMSLEWHIPEGRHEQRASNWMSTRSMQNTWLACALLESITSALSAWKLCFCLEVHSCSCGHDDVQYWLNASDSSTPELADDDWVLELLLLGAPNCSWEYEVSLQNWLGGIQSRMKIVSLREASWPSDHDGLNCAGITLPGTPTYMAWSSKLLVCDQSCIVCSVLVCSLYTPRLNT